MKKIEAYIKKIRLAEVIERLHLLEGLTGVSVHDIHGYGRMQGLAGPSRIVDNMIKEQPHVKLEIVCLESLAEAVVESIRAGAHTGLRADGKIYISDIRDAVRISTGERGEGAV